MTYTRRCDACGQVEEWPFAGWLTVETYARDTRKKRSAWDEEAPRLRFDVCSHECLPELAFNKAEEFIRVREREEEIEA